MNNFNKALFGRMLQLRTRVLDEDLAVQDPDEHAEIWARYQELRDLASRLGLMEDFHRFASYRHFLETKEEHHEVPTL